MRMKPFQLGTKVWKKGIVTSRLDERSYVMETSDGDTYRRNRYHLRKTKESPDAPAILDVTPVERPGDSSSPETSLTETPNQSQSTSETPATAPKSPLRPQRFRRPPAYLKDYVTAGTLS